MSDTLLPGSSASNGRKPIPASNRKTAWPALAGRDVVIMPDQDTDGAGDRYGEIARNLARPVHGITAREALEFAEERGDEVPELREDQAGFSPKSLGKYLARERGVIRQGRRLVAIDDRNRDGLRWLVESTPATQAASGTVPERVPGFDGSVPGPGPASDPGEHAGLTDAGSLDQGYTTAASLEEFASNLTKLNSSVPEPEAKLRTQQTALAAKRAASII